VWLSFVQNTVVVSQIFVQAALGCFFEAELKLFVGCVDKSQRKSIDVKKSQKTSIKVNSALVYP